MSVVWNVVYLGNPKPIRDLVYDEIISVNVESILKKGGQKPATQLTWQETEVQHNIQKYQRQKAQSEMYVKGKQKQQKKVNPK